LEGQTNKLWKKQRLAAAYPGLVHFFAYSIVADYLNEERYDFLKPENFFIILEKWILLNKISTFGVN